MTAVLQRAFGGARELWARARTGRDFDVLFFAAWWVDEVWTRSTTLEAARRGLRVALAVTREPGAREAKLVQSYAQAGVRILSPIASERLRALRVPVVVSATNGLKRESFHPGIAHLAHMPHSLVSLHMIYLADSFDGFDTLFACGPHHTREFARLCAMRRLDGRRSREVGYGKLDLLTDSAPLAAKQVLIAPSWGEKNIFNTVGEELIEGLLARGLDVVVRPHPMFAERADPQWTGLCAKFAGRRGFATENPLDGDGAIGSAAAVVTDYSGIAFEYAALRRRRSVFIDVAKKVLNPDWRDAGLEPVEVGERERLGIVVPADTARILPAIEQCLADPPAREDVGRALAAFLVNRGRCGEAACDALVEMAGRAS